MLSKYIYSGLLCSFNNSSTNSIPIRFEEYVFEPDLYPPKASFEQTNIFIQSCAACIVASIVFSKGAPYRKHLFTNGNTKLLITFPLSFSTTHIIIIIVT